MYTGTRRLLTLLVSGLLAMVLLVFVQSVDSAPTTDVIGTLEDDFPSVPVARPNGDLRAQVVYPAPVLPTPSTPITLPEEVWRIGIITDGLYSLSYEELALAGVPVSGTNPTDFHLSWRNQDVSLDGTGLGDGTFNAGDTLIFFGEAFHGTVQEEKYTGENVYWLSVDDTTTGPLMASRVVSPTGFTATGICTVTEGVNDNLRYFGRWTVSQGTDTTWYWDRIPASANTVVTTTAMAYYKSQTTFNIDTINPAPTPQAQIEVEMASKGTAQHALLLSVNDTVLGEWVWYGKASKVVTATIPDGLLVDGSNVVDLYLGELDNARTMYLDRVEITYLQQPTAVDGSLICNSPSTGMQDFTVTGVANGSMLYDISSVTQTVKLTGFTLDGLDILHFTDNAGAEPRYIAAPIQSMDAASVVAYSPANDLVAPAEGADEIIIAPALFHTALQPLIAHRESQGLRVALVDVEDLYPLFNGGIYHPEAIRSFIAWAYTSWPGDAPAYVFLVGDGNFNMRGHNPASYGELVPSHIPPYLFFDDPTQGEVPVDARYGDVVADLNGLPELAVGRLTANTVSEVVKYVDKVLRYEGLPADHSLWHNQAILMADDGASYPENFDVYLSTLDQNNIPAVVNTEQIYMRDMCDGPSYTPCVTATNALVDSWNDGALWLLYSGHGAVQRWANEPLMMNTDFISLTQKDALPFLVSLDCWDGYWMLPPEYPGLAGQNLNSVGEWVTAILTETGAIGAYGPAGLAYSYEESQLTAGVLDSYFEDGERRLGDLADAGRMPISRTYMARTYTLLGDPAVVMHSYTPSRVYLPMTLK